MRRSVGLAGFLVGLALALPAGASADTYCVVSGPCDVGHTAPDLGTALTLANNPATGTDTIELPAGDITAGVAPSDVVGQPVHVIGAGSTTVIKPALAGPDLTLSDPGSSVSNLTLQLGSAGPSIGLGLVGGSADHVNVTAAGPGVLQTGVLMGPAIGGSTAAATLRDSTISLPIATGTTAIMSGTTGAVVQNVTATAFTDLTGSASVQRSLFHGVTGATVTGGVNPILITETPGVLTVDDSTFVLQGSGGTPATGFTATQGATFFGPTSATVTARHVNLIGDGSANSVAAAVWATLSPLAGSVVSATFANSVLHGFQHRFSRTGSASIGLGSVDVPANVSATYSDFDTSSDAADAGPGSTTLGAGNLTADPQLRDPSNGDYRLKGSSPLIDAGDPAVPGAGEPGVDEAGLARIFGGRTDIGAFEYQGAPTADSLTSAPNPANVGQTVTFTLQGATAHETAITDYKWDLDGNGSFETDTGTAPSASHAFAAAGSYKVAVEAIAADGGSVTKSVTQVVLAPAAPAPVTVNRFAVSPSVFAVGAGATAKSAAKRPAKGAAKGTTFRYSLSHAARVTIAIAQKLTGHRKGHACVKSGKGKRCTLFVTADSLTRSSASGANSLKFSGRIGRRALKPGTYKATIVAVDAAGQRSAPRSVTFRIVKA